MTMKLYKCDICGQEICSMPDKLIFTNIKKCYWVFATYKEETLDVCLDCQRDLRKALDRVNNNDTDLLRKQKLEEEKQQ